MEVRDPKFAVRLLASVRSGVLAIDATGALAALNGEAQRILGCPEGSPADALGRPCASALGAQPVIAELLLEALDGRDAPARTELELAPRTGGRERTIGFTLSAIPGPGGSLDGVAMLFRDLTPYERLDEQDRLRERLAALGQMAAGLAHQLRNPLASMEVLVGLLKRRLGAQPDEQVMLSELAGELGALAETVTASLDFVKPLVLVREAVDPVELLEESLALARSRVRYAGAIERDYLDDCPSLAADAEALRGVVTDLIVNALEAMAARRGGGAGVLRLGLARAPDAASMRPVLIRAGERRPRPRAPRESLVISVQDTGVGIPPELRDRVFYPFFTTKERGSGIGLANAQKVVASHGGALELEARAGVGTRFAVTLPIGVEGPACR